MDEITGCTCDLTTGCGEYDEAGCPACAVPGALYLPCPVFGNMCGIPGDPPCDCCTPEQQEMTWRYYTKSDSLQGLDTGAEQPAPAPAVYWPRVSCGMPGCPEHGTPMDGPR
ncbi:hypothetical protein [Nocardia brasiliensis]|uniref:hypothetical protein n=1 Tax=Nocardia brasiliensis TaxID=37326 RepID=UPI0024582FD4|nr:hypothetical protein [Nocardia brasiliensis]